MAGSGETVTACRDCDWTLEKVPNSDMRRAKLAPLIGHVRRIHYGYQPFHCGHCSGLFPTLSDMIDHCDICHDGHWKVTSKRNLVIESNIDDNIRRILAANVNGSLDEKTIEDQADKMAKVGGFITCPDCQSNVEFSKKDHLRLSQKRISPLLSHLSRIHYGYQPYSCDICLARFPTLTDIEHHTELMHSGEWKMCSQRNLDVENKIKENLQRLLTSNVVSADDGPILDNAAGNVLPYPNVGSGTPVNILHTILHRPPSVESRPNTDSNIWRREKETARYRSYRTSRRPYGSRLKGPINKTSIPALEKYSHVRGRGRGRGRGRSSSRGRGRGRGWYYAGPGRDGGAGPGRGPAPSSLPGSGLGSLPCPDPSTFSHTKMDAQPCEVTNESASNAGASSHCIDDCFGSGSFPNVPLVSSGVGEVPCPYCSQIYKARGMTLHIYRAHFDQITNDQFMRRCNRCGTYIYIGCANIHANHCSKTAYSYQKRARRRRAPKLTFSASASKAERHDKPTEQAGQPHGKHRFSQENDNQKGQDDQQGPSDLGRSSSVVIADNTSPSAPDESMGQFEMGDSPLPVYSGFAVVKLEPDNLQ